MLSYLVKEISFFLIILLFVEGKIVLVSRYCVGCDIFILYLVGCIILCCSFISYQAFAVFKFHLIALATLCLVLALIFQY